MEPLNGLFRSALGSRAHVKEDNKREVKAISEVIKKMMDIRKASFIFSGYPSKEISD